ncbi:MAG: chloride channel protein [Planctomycetaceae bacterium]|jgi:CIC family chloride channel protein|nr:chloride channel protein [Planctomycetaceae bacterium]
MIERHSYYSHGCISKLRIKFNIETTGRLLLGAILIGLLAGTVAAGFYYTLSEIRHGVNTLYQAAGIDFVSSPSADATEPLSITSARLGNNARTDHIFDYFVVPKYWLLIVLIPGFGGLCCGIIVCTFANEAKGEGTDMIIKAFHLRNGIIRFRLLIVKAISSLVTLGSGGSAGYEGPTALIGAGSGSLLCRFLKTNAMERRVLLLAGAAGGIGAIFQVPVGGCLYACEILYCSTALELNAVLPCLIASTIGYATFRYFIGSVNTTMFCQPFQIEIDSGLFVHIPMWIVFTIICAMLGWVYVRLLHEMRNRVWRRLAIPDFIKPAVGGVLVGCVGIFFPQVFGGGYEWLSPTINGLLSLKLMAALVVAKMLATTLTLASGGSGGLLVPSIFLGALIGGTFGSVVHLVCDSLGCGGVIPQLSTFVILGMATFYAGIGKAPLAAAVMTCEIVGASYYWVVPLFVCSLVHLVWQSPRTSLYEEQVLTPLDSPAHFGDYVIDLLQVIQVKNVVKIDDASVPLNTVLITESATMADIMRQIASSTDTHFPVIDANRSFVGLISLSDVRSAFVSLGDWRLVVAADLAQQPDMFVLPDDSLYTVLRNCHRGSITEIPVVDSAETRHVVGVIRRHEIIAAYNDSISRYRDPTGE